ncbi:MAG TPA: imidazole glycerol phosphate synthase subunit HisH [Gammaproteobacteria bacterium]|nr:imidazole glycerol phosphate synthase subunit HisH [Gammaproteobacteria bacterium]
MSSIAVIDYGMGNLHSIAKALERVAPRDRVLITDRHAVARRADRVVLPGVGAIRHCMEQLREHELAEAVRELAANRPFLGICLGLQALLERSEENNGTAGLGIFRGKVQRFAEGLHERPGDAGIRIPHMGWNRVEPARGHPLWRGIRPGARFYFVHSYYARVDAEGVAATTDYGVRFASALARDNVFAVQFHPEKSQQAGLKLLENFAGWDGRP